MADVLGCNLCNTKFVPRLPLQDGYILRDEVKVELKCPKCNSRARIRALGSILNMAQLFGALPLQHRALYISASVQERRVLNRVFDESDHISYQGDHSDPLCRVGVDICNMPDIRSMHYDAVVATVVLDYIPDVEKALAEIARVLKINGVFLFYIQPWRILDDDNPPRVVHRNALAYEKYAIILDGKSGIPDCRFGVRWLADEAKKVDLSFDQITVADPISTLIVDWYICRRLG